MSVTDSIQRSRETWRELEGAYKKSGLVLAFGAGVSVMSGLPTWDELMRRIAEQCLGCEGRELVDELRNAGFGYPAIAGMLKTRSPEGKDFASLVRQELYRDFPKDLHAARYPKWGRLVPVVKENSTLRAVAALCAVATKEPGRFHRNPKIHGIINFNLDAVFRAYVHARYPRGRHPIVRTVERPSKAPNPKKINVYYMHGFLRFDEKRDEPHEASDKLVLSEHEYFDFFNSPTSLFNYAFLYLLREHACLFVGLSMQDDNIRRLLHYSAQERLGAYREEKKRRPRERTRRHFAILKRSASDDRDALVQDSLAELGTKVLWIADYDKIPDRLGAVYGANGGDWSTVY